MTKAAYIAEVAPTLGRRNLLINGDMRVWQRGAGGPLPANQWTYTADRWICDCYGATITWGQGGTPTSPSRSPGSLVFSGAAGNTGFSIRQRIESLNVAHTYGKRLTLSCRLYVTGAARNIPVALYRPTAKDNFATLALVDGGTTFAHPGGGTWIKATHTFATVMPAEVANGLVFLISNNPLGAGQEVAVTDVQLEVGEEATPFETLPIGTVISECERYYETGYQMMDYRAGILSPTAYGSIPFKTRKRANATIKATNWYYYSDGTPTLFSPTLIGRANDFYWTAGSLPNCAGWTPTGTWSADAEL